MASFGAVNPTQTVTTRRITKTVSLSGQRGIFALLVSRLLEKKASKTMFFGDAPITLNAKSPLKMTMAFLQVQKNTLAGFVATI